MLTNDLKKGDEVILRCGWDAIIEDNKKGNIRMVKVYGNYTETGSIYVWDIAFHRTGEGKLVKIKLTPKQLKDQTQWRYFYERVLKC